MTEKMLPHIYVDNHADLLSTVKKLHDDITSGYKWIALSYGSVISKFSRQSQVDYFTKTGNNSRRYIIVPIKQVQIKIKQIGGKYD